MTLVVPKLNYYKSWMAAFLFFLLLKPLSVCLAENSAVKGIIRRRLAARETEKTEEIAGMPHW